MPRREITKVRMYHLSRVCEFLLHHTLSLEFWRFELLDYHLSVAPAVEVARVADEHHAAETELFGPQATCNRYWEQDCGLLQEPDALVPDPVALWPLLQQRDQEYQVSFDCVQYNICAVLRLKRRTTLPSLRAVAGRQGRARVRVRS